MGFTTQIFLFIFFPISILSYILVEFVETKNAIGKYFKYKAKDLITIAFGMAFYAWACFNDVFFLCAYIIAVYVFAIIIEVLRTNNILHSRVKNLKPSQSDNNFRLIKAEIGLILGVVILLAILVYYKYFNFIFSNIYDLIGHEYTYRTILAPIGISFITFSAVSYLIDIYRGNATAGSLIDCALYISFFPKIISGPIVLWKDFQHQIRDRRTDLDGAVTGINRIMIGFAKKVILADSFGAYIQNIGNTNIDQISAFLTVLLYMLQIYYDFAGYSDIAIGLSKLFGFDVKENFNFPYRSKSITEFWRRWHISLGTWFREYVYFSLGGSRGTLVMTLRNLAIVFY